MANLSITDSLALFKKQHINCTGNVHSNLSYDLNVRLCLRITNTGKIGIVSTLLTEEIGVCQSSEDYRVLLLLQNVNNMQKVLTYSLDNSKVQGRSRFQ